jgi:DNA polymerase-3 subunit alpha
MSAYIPLHNYSHYSLLLGLSKHKEIATRCLEIGATSCAITDNGSISGCVSFYKEMITNNIKPILGCELNIIENDKLSKIILLCKNLEAWKNLIRIVSITNSKEFFDKKPRIDLDNLSKIVSNQHFICITGYYDSTLWNISLSDSYEDNAKNHIDKLKSIFGNNVYIEINRIEENNTDITNKINQIAISNSIKTIAGIETYYCNKQDAADQKILLCSNLKTTLPEISKKVLSNTDTGFNRFFNSDNFYIIDNDLAKSLYSEEELNNTIEIANMCESYSPLSKPILPKFPYPEKYSSASEYLRDLCRQGWKEKIQNIIPQDKQQVYVDRIKHELEVLDGAGLSSYFLIVRDILSFVRDNKWLPGPGRGSAAGCLVSYLIGITNIDPIKYELLFERFYSDGRNVTEHVSFPEFSLKDFTPGV